MGLETATHISDLVITNPVGATDQASTLDDHIRLIKSVLKTDFAGITGAVTATHTELNGLHSLTASRALVTTAGGIVSASAVTATELALLSGLTSSAAELNSLDGYTGNVSDLNILSGAAAAGLTAAELQYVKSVTSDIQTQIDAKLPTSSASETFISLQTASSSASIVFTFDSTYDTYVIEGNAVLPASSGYNLVCQYSTDGGSTWVTSAEYGGTRSEVDTSGTQTLTGYTAGTSIAMTGAMSNTADYGGVNFTFKIKNTSNTTQRKRSEWSGCGISSSSVYTTFSGSGETSNSTVVTGDVTAIKFYFSSGNIASGTFTQYGKRKS